MFVWRFYAYNSFSACNKGNRRHVHCTQAITSHSDWKTWPEAHSPEIIGILKQDVITFYTSGNTSALAMKKKTEKKNRIKLGFQETAHLPLP